MEGFILVGVWGGGGATGVVPLVDELRTESAVAAKPDVGVTVFATLCTAESRGWPVCPGLRLSASSLFLYLLHQGVFAQTEILPHLLPPGTSVTCKCQC